MNAGIDPLADAACGQALLAAFGGGGGGLTPCLTRTTVAAITYPSQTPAFADSVAGQPQDPTVNPLGDIGFIVYAIFPIDQPGGPTRRHSQGMNIGMLDGHVNWYRLESVIEKTEDPSIFAQGFAYVPDLTCENYNAAHLYWDPTGPDPTQQPTKPANCP